MTKPSLHLNGSSHADLSNHYRQAYREVDHAIDAVIQTAPHGRDYYVQHQDAYQAARAEHLDRLKRLESVKAELLALFQAVDEQAAHRRPRGSYDDTTIQEA